MKTYNIKIANDKSIKCLNGNIICRKGETNIDELAFDVDENLLQYNNFLILYSPNKTTYIDIITNDLRYVIGSYITNEVGTWTIQFLSSTQEDILAEDEIDDEKIIMISDTLTLAVKNSLVSDELVFPPTSSNLDLLGEQLSNIYNTLSVVIEEYPQIQDYIAIQDQMGEVISRLSGLKNVTENTIVSNQNKLIDRIGNNDTKADGTLFNYSYWGLIRAEEAKSLSQQVLNKLDVIANKLDNM